MVERKRYALLFPGQGSQKVGMGHELWKASNVVQDTFKEADEIGKQLGLGFVISEVCFYDPKNQLEGLGSDTAVIQPCLMTVSVAIARHLKQEGIHEPEIVLGHSAGKYSALVANEAMNFKEGLDFVSQRGVVMKEARDDLGVIVGLVRGVEHNRISQLLAELSVRANLNDTDLKPALTTINSRVQSLVLVPAYLWESVVLELKNLGAKVSAYLNASPSHYYGLERAQQILNGLNLRLKTPNVPILDDLTSSVLRTAEEIEASVSKHLIAPVFWRYNMNWLEQEGIVNAIEVGPGRVLQGIAAQEYPGLEVSTTDSLENINLTCRRYLPGSVLLQ